ncbi:hypothetical protein [Lysobacter gummosus]|jgi:hypothetical protein|uniref:hypothetical protein n=1 Tax=Lysobacter gummosus TaxID=262324 RepID=UPI00363FB225
MLAGQQAQYTDAATVSIKITRPRSLHESATALHRLIDSTSGPDASPRQRPFEIRRASHIVAPSHARARAVHSRWRKRSIRARSMLRRGK